METGGNNRGRSEGSKRTQFKPGHGPRTPKPKPERVEGEFDRLKTMRYVLNNPASLDQTAGEKAMRAFLIKSPGAFMETLDRLANDEADAAEVATEASVERSETDEELHLVLDGLIARALEKAARLPGR